MATAPVRGLTLRIESNFQGAAEHFEAAAGNLTRFDKKFGYRRPKQSLWDRMGRSWRQSRAAMFLTLGRVTDSPWPTYDQTDERLVYVHVKARLLKREITSADVLRWDGTDRIFKSMTIAGHPQNVNVGAPLTAEFGTSLSYAANHNLGIGNAPDWMGGHAIPHRPLTRIGTALRRRWEDDLIEYTVDAGAAIGQPLTATQARLLPLAT